MKFRKLLFLFISIVLSGTQLMAQLPALTMPQESQKATVSQQIGLTDIIVEYHRPGVKGRTVWGDLVPYGKVWRAGANDNTTIFFSDDVTVNGTPLPAGKYGLHMIPEEKEWTVIFSNVNTAWGSFSYDSKNDALRITTIPQDAGMNEWLMYSFKEPAENSVQLVMHWEKIKIAFKIEVDLHAVVLKNIRAELESLPRFGWQGWNQAANYCMQNKVNLQEGMQWVDRSIDMNRNFTNLNTKSGLLKLAGDNKGAESLYKEALKIATEAELNTYGYQLMGKGDLAGAIEIFKMNVDRFPDSWNVYDSLGEAYANKGDKKQARKLYQKAQNMVKDDTQKKRIEEVLEKL